MMFSSVTAVFGATTVLSVFGVSTTTFEFTVPVFNGRYLSGKLFSNGKFLHSHSRLLMRVKYAVSICRIFPNFPDTWKIVTFLTERVCVCVIDFLLSA